MTDTRSCDLRWVVAIPVGGLDATPTRAGTSPIRRPLAPATLDHLGLGLDHTLTGHAPVVVPVLSVLVLEGNTIDSS